MPGIESHADVTAAPPNPVENSQPSIPAEQLLWRRRMLWVPRGLVRRIEFPMPGDSVGAEWPPKPLAEVLPLNACEAVLGPWFADGETVPVFCVGAFQSPHCRGVALLLVSERYADVGHTCSVPEFELVGGTVIVPRRTLPSPVHAWDCHGDRRDDMRWQLRQEPKAKIENEAVR